MKLKMPDNVIIFPTRPQVMHYYLMGYSIDKLAELFNVSKKIIIKVVYGERKSCR